MSDKIAPTTGSLVGEMVEIVTEQNYFYHGLCFSESDSEFGLYDQKIGKMKINQKMIAEKRPIQHEHSWQFYWTRILNRLNSIDSKIVKTDKELGEAFKIAIEKSRRILYARRR